ncbi:MAG: serine/threonine protein kinase [Ignavibacteriales bacterium]|nr:serine/threonine protein kinase [Ignavibacteriales bacterium]
MSQTNNEILFKKFEILSCYKKDEHSAVYLANHIFLEKKVFLKILNTETIPDQSITERFKREAKILAQLEHPNIIKVFDFGMFKSYFYISFEYFESKNLREFLNTQPITEENKKNIFIQLVKGLDFAHKKNVIHRDIKPENILVNKNLEVKLTDFGLAQDSLDNLVTQRYSVVGTPAYMSPEQIQGEKLTIKSDLFSLGITAAEIFSGKNPFLGNDANETINNILSFNEKENENFFTEYDENIQLVLKGLLASNTKERFNSCEEILKIFHVVNIEPQTSVKQSSKKYWIAAIIVLALIPVLWLISNNKSTTDELKSKSIEAKKNDKVDSLANDKLEIATAEINNLPKSKIVNEKSDEVNKTENETSKTVEEKLQADKPKIKSEEFGELFIKCYPWAKVYLNNKYIETTPLSKNINTKTGEYLLTLIHPDYPKYSENINITKEKLKFVEVNLDTLFGYFQCQVFPWSEIIINGEKKGVTPLENPIRLNEGKYNLVLSNPQYKRIETQISINKNDTLFMKFNMKDGSYK